MSASVVAPVVALATTAAAQYFQPPVYGIPTGNGLSNAMPIQFGGFQGGYGRSCPKGVKSSKDGPRCFCDKNHRDEDYCPDLCNSLLGIALGGRCEDDCRENKGQYRDLGVDATDYFEDHFDPFCVQQWQQPTNVRRCPAKIKSKDIFGQAVCFCDANHRKDADYLEDAGRECTNLDAISAISFDPIEVLAAAHYTKWTPSKLGLRCDSAGFTARDFDEVYEKFDPNCVERFGGYGSYGGYGGYRSMGAYGGFGQQQLYGGFGQQQLGRSLFYPAYFAQPVAGSATTSAVAFQPPFGMQFPQQRYYAQQQGYTYGR